MLEIFGKKWRQHEIEEKNMFDFFFVSCYILQYLLPYIFFKYTASLF